MNFIPKRAVKILLKRYLNPYLRDEISLEQIDAVDFQTLRVQDLVFDTKVRCR